jgi:hypothetical protein
MTPSTSRPIMPLSEAESSRRVDDEALDALRERRFVQLQELLGADMKPGARQDDLTDKLGIAKLVSYAFSLVAEKAFERNAKYKFEPISLTTYADGHRMLSVTGIIVERAKARECLEKMNLSDVPGGVSSWNELVDIQIPQLTVWEKLVLDREVHGKSAAQLSKVIDFRLHETISTTELLEGYGKFQRFYPTFRHVLL